MECQRKYRRRKIVHINYEQHKLGKIILFYMTFNVCKIHEIASELENLYLIIKLLIFFYSTTKSLRFIPEFWTSSLGDDKLKLEILTINSSFDENFFYKRDSVECINSDVLVHDCRTKRRNRIQRSQALEFVLIC